MSITILNPGMLTSVQDLGRIGYQQFGVSVSGVMDPRSASIANILVGNDEGEAVLECTMMGPHIRFDAPNIIAITGGDLGATLDGQRIDTYRAIPVNAGQTLRFTILRTGCRAFVAFAGGLDIPVVMGSRSTNMKAKIGGYQGRKLQKDDVIGFRAPKTDLKNLGLRHTSPEFMPRAEYKFYNDLQSNGRLRKVQKKEKPGLSNSTVRGIHMMLHNALDRAVKEKLILSNPTENCIIPKIEKQEMKILHPDHISAYLNAAERRNALPMFYLELVSGLRKGELVALQWSDLDEANCTISVSKQASWDTEHQLILSRPKTGNSIREVSIPQDAVELLKQEHAKHPSNPWMFPSGRTGEMYHPDSVVTLHKRILKDAGLEHIRFHDLRHTFATLALQNGVDVKTVSSMLGHYDAGFTLRTYTHVTRQKQDEAAQTMGSFMAQVM